MRKKFAPLALLFGLLTAMMLASTSMAQATTPLPTLAGCSNSGVAVNVVTCSDVLNDILNNPVVKITDVRVLSGNELTILNDALNDAHINVDLLNITAAKQVVVNVYNNNIDPAINVGDITVSNVKICLGACL